MPTKPLLLALSVLFALLSSPASASPEAVLHVVTSKGTPANGANGWFLPSSARPLHEHFADTFNDADQYAYVQQSGEAVRCDAQQMALKRVISRLQP